MHEKEGSLFEAQFMKKLSNIEVELNESVA